MTVTMLGAVIRPRPRAKTPPASTSRSTATWSFQSSLASSRMRLATGFQSGTTVAVPAWPSTSRAARSLSAAAIIILVGTHP
ncbi:hypothetical protein ABH927_000154 [Planotetraspora sp. GP83]